MNSIAEGIKADVRELVSNLCEGDWDTWWLSSALATGVVGLWLVW